MSILGLSTLEQRKNAWVPGGKLGSGPSGFDGGHFIPTTRSSLVYITANFFLLFHFRGTKITLKNKVIEKLANDASNLTIFNLV